MRAIAGRLTLRGLRLGCPRPLMPRRMTGPRASPTNRLFEGVGQRLSGLQKAIRQRRRCRLNEKSCPVFYVKIVKVSTGFIVLSTGVALGSHKYEPFSEGDRSGR